MDVKEILKVRVLKWLCLAWVSYMLVLVTLVERDVSSEISAAGASMAGFYLYMNLFRVKSEVIELFEPPYPTVGNGLGFITFLCLVTSICLQIQEG